MRSSDAPLTKASSWTQQGFMKRNEEHYNRNDRITINKRNPTSKFLTASKGETRSQQIMNHVVHRMLIAQLYRMQSSPS